MPTATKTPPKKQRTATKSAPQLPAWPGLPIDIVCELAAEFEASVADHHRDCRKFEDSVAQLHDDRAGILAGGLKMTVESVIEAGRDLAGRHAGAQQQLTELRWRRFELLPKLVPDFRREVENAEKAVADRIELVAQHFRDLGVDTDSFPAGETNIRAAQVQLEQRIKQTPEVLAAIGRRNRAKAASAGLIGQTKSVPRPKPLPNQPATPQELSFYSSS